MQIMWQKNVCSPLPVSSPPVPPKQRHITRIRTKVTGAIMVSRILPSFRSVMTSLCAQSAQDGDEKHISNVMPVCRKEYRAGMIDQSSIP